MLPQNWQVSAHERFDSIFTWSEDLFSKGGKYFETHFAQDLLPPIGLTPFASRKFCTLIAGNKSNRHQLELYSERINAIRFFESRSGNFDLYGMGWERLTHGSFLAKVINRLSPWLSQKLARPAISYRGKVESKFAVLQNYKFAICFENAHSIPGYVTEKIFDCLNAGCVPVYWGAPDINKFVPAECYIDIRQCKSYDDLLVKLTNFTAADYEAFLSATTLFLQSSAARRFSCEAFAETISMRLGSS